jgi:hypothetical protein
MVVEFASQFEKAPPPGPLLLALHPICARVARMSSATEFFDQLERDTKEIKALALMDHLLLYSEILCPLLLF